MGSSLSIQILTRCCSQVIEDEGEIEDRPIIEQIPVIEEKVNESFRTIIPTQISWKFDFRKSGFMEIPETRIL